MASSLHKIANPTDAQVDVIFVHGLKGDPYSTWMPDGRKNRDNSWPYWLAAADSRAGVYSLQYEANPFRRTGTYYPLTTRAAEVLTILESERIGDRPLIWVTHSLGGLLVKQMLKHIQDNNVDNLTPILEQTRSIFFYATPHTGSNIANWIDYVGFFVRSDVSELSTHSEYLFDLNNWFRNFADERSITVECFYETKPTKGLLVVNRASADPGIRKVLPRPVEDADHQEICKPSTPSNFRCKLLLRKIDDVLELHMRHRRDEAAEFNQRFDNDYDLFVNSSLDEELNYLGNIDELVREFLKLQIQSDWDAKQAFVAISTINSSSSSLHDNLYVDLHVTPHSSESSVPYRNTDLKTEMKHLYRDESNDSRILLEDYIGNSSSRLFFLIGEPGSGKSTTSQNLYRVINEQDYTSDALRNRCFDYTPLFIRLSVLSELSDESLISHDAWRTLTKYICYTYRYSVAEANAILSSFRDNNRLFIIFDGLDEVSEHGSNVEEIRQYNRGLQPSSRINISRWINSFADTPELSESIVFVTARSYLFRDTYYIERCPVEYRDYLRFSKFSFSSLRPLNEQQKLQYISQYSKSLYGDETKAVDHASDFVGYLNQARIARFRSVIGRPLLMSMACAVYFDRSEKAGPLPENMIQLYEEFIGVVLSRWPSYKTGKQKEFFSPLRESENFPAFRKSLEMLAWESFQYESEADFRSLKYNTVESCVKKLLEYVSVRGSLFNAEHIIEYLEDQSGLLVSPSTSSFEFAHLSLQEYLASCFSFRRHSSKDDPTDRFFYRETSHYGMRKSVYSLPDRYREVLRLGVGIAVNESNSELLENILSTCIMEPVERISATRGKSYDVSNEELTRAETTAEAVYEFSGEKREVALDEMLALSTERLGRIAFQSSSSTKDIRAFAGRMAGWLGDTRSGVGVRSGMPDIAFSDIPIDHLSKTADEKRFYEMGDGKTGTIEAEYSIGTYPITWEQYNVFVDAPDGYLDPDNWQGIARYQRRSEYNDVWWAIPNHPREHVSFFEAMAFCSWLTRRYAGESPYLFRLPTDSEWEYAATGGRPHEFQFPWGSEYKVGFANINEVKCKYNIDKKIASALARTTAVGLYEKGRTRWNSDVEIYDMAGNVLEWCLFDKKNEPLEWDNPDIGVSVRGGSWNHSDSPAGLSVLKQSFKASHGGERRGFRIIRTLRR